MNSPALLPVEAVVRRLPPYIDARIAFRGRWLWLLLALVLIKSAGLLVDPAVRLFLGDSATYLVSALDHTTPPDRSFTYPMLLRFSVVPLQSLQLLSVLQSVFGILTCLLVAWIVRVPLGGGRRAAAVAALLLAIDPLQLFYERMVMTESSSTLGVLLMLALALQYIRRPRWWTMLACIVVGVGVASLRVGLVPLALSMPIGAAVLGTRWSPRPLRWAGLVALTLLATFSAHNVYKRWYAARAQVSQPVYLRDAGLYRLGLVAPVLEREDMLAGGADPALLDNLAIPLRDPDMREAQIWNPTGLIAAMRRQYGEHASSIARKVAGHALRTHFWAMLRMGLTTQWEFSDPVRRNQRLQDDLGTTRDADPRVAARIGETLHYDVSEHARHASLAGDYLAWAWRVPVFALWLSAPFGLAMLLFPPRAHRRAARLVGLLALCLFGGHVYCAHIMSFRYLHPFFAVDVLACVGGFARLLSRNPKSSSTLADPAGEISPPQTVNA